MAEMKENAIRPVQLNEKISDTAYNVLHPETTAEQVITNDDRQFVSKIEKEKWNSASESFQAVGLKYRGTWSDSTKYVKNDVVSYGNRYFVAIAGTETTPNLNNAPSKGGDTSYWKNFNKEAELASKASSVLVKNPTNNAAHQLTFVVNGGSTEDYENVYADSNLTYNPDSNQLHLSGKESGGKHVDSLIKADRLEGKLDGKNVTGVVPEAQIASEYVVSKKQPDGKPQIGTDGRRIKDKTVYIEDSVDGLKKKIDSIETGGASTKGSLTIKGTKKDAEGNQVVISTILDKYKGISDTTINIQQIYNPTDIEDFLDIESKIKEKWLPASVLGQLSYKGTFDPTVINSFPANDGDYYIAKKASTSKAEPGKYNPDGTTVTKEDDYYNTGDWAVCHNGVWAKIDNTDAVTMVNGQKGAVETYKGAWTPNKPYFVGDIVKYGDALYICNSKHDGAGVFDTLKFDIFGRTYSAEDGIKLDGTIFKHNVAMQPDASISSTLTSKDILEVPSLTRDNFGHVTKITTKKITLSDDFKDTTRPIKLDDTLILTGEGPNRHTALNIKHDKWISITNDGGTVNFEHINNQDGAQTVTSTRVDNPDAAAEVLYPGQGYKVPNFKYDEKGHVSNASYTTFKLADALVKHKHFNIVKDTSGAQVIQAYNANNNAEGQAWVASAANALKFYTGTAVPNRTDTMKFNGSFDATDLKKKGVSVLDRNVIVNHGLKHDGKTPINSTYNEKTNTIEVGDSGVAKGVFSAVEVNAKGIVTAGGQIVEFGQTVNADPSASLAVGGLFFRRLA